MVVSSNDSAEMHVWLLFHVYVFEKS